MASEHPVGAKDSNQLGTDTVVSASLIEDSETNNPDQISADKPAASLTSRRCASGHEVLDQEAKFCSTCGLVLTSVTVSVSEEVTAEIVLPQSAQTTSSTTVTTVAIDKPAVAQSPAVVIQCNACRDGAQFEEGKNICSSCRRIRPLASGYVVEPAWFQWAQDGQAMAKLRSITALNRVARKVSDQVGRRWVESTFNGVRLSEKQMPHVYLVAVEAARRLGVHHMPDVYVSGSYPWDIMTFGSDENAFIVVGSALVASFRGRDLGFLFAREMGHIVAGHALWKTVIRFLVGEHNPRSGLMRGGVVGLLDPGKWLEGAIEVPLLNWARQAEITADRAGLLAIGDLPTARRVLLSWSLRSPMLYPQINVSAWLEQQAEDIEDESLRLAEMVTSPTPYISRRLSLLDDYRNSDTLRIGWNRIQELTKLHTNQAAGVSNSTKSEIDKELGVAIESTESNSDSRQVQESTRINTPAFTSRCTECNTLIQVAAEAFKQREKVGVCCPNSSCDKRYVISRQQAELQRQQASALSTDVD